MTIENNTITIDNDGRSFADRGHAMAITDVTPEKVEKSWKWARSWGDYLKVGSWFHGRSNRKVLACLSNTHLEVIHAIRRLAFRLQDWNENESTDIAHQVCTACCKTMADMLGLKASKLHCCLKLIIVKCGDEPNQISTYVRSAPFDLRPCEQGAENAHKIGSNTVWSAMCGVDDASTKWKPVCCFSCNNLTSHKNFHCDRDDWERYYKSTVVFPIRYANDSAGMDLIQIGFLTFDSPDINAFPHMPDVFDSISNPSAYEAALQASPVFHLGAIFSDILGALLGPTYAAQRTTNER